MKLTVYMCVCVKACVRFGKHAHAQCENVCVCMHVCVCACERQLVLGGGGVFKIICFDFEVCLVSGIFYFFI